MRRAKYIISSVLFFLAHAAFGAQLDRLEKADQDANTMQYIDRSMSKMSPDGRDIVSLIIPLDIPERASFETVSSKIADRTFQSIGEGKLFPDSSINQINQRVQQSLKTEVSLGKTNHINHKIQMALAVADRKIKFSYSGLALVDVTYLGDDNAAEVEIHGPITKTAEWALCHIGKTQTNLFRISLAWN